MRSALLVLVALLLGCGVGFTPDGSTNVGGNARATGGAGAAMASGGASAVGAGGMTAGVGSAATGVGGRGGTATSGAGGCVGTMDHAAVIAACIDETAPDPDACETFTGAGQMLLDTSLSGPGTPHHIYLRFDVPNPSAATEVSLTLTVTNHSQAVADQTGEVWTVEPFDLNDLSSAMPADVMRVAQDQGGVQPGDTVTFQLSPALIDSSPVYLGMHPVTTDHPVYWNASGTVPPLLRIQCP